MKTSLLIRVALLALVHGQRAVGASALAININPLTQVSDAGVYSPGIFFGFDESGLITNGMYGWTFLLTERATVTGLAWYDENPAGLSHAHQIGVWQYDSGSTNWDINTNAPLLFSLTVPAGTNATLLNGVWREVDLGSPTNLPLGSYVVAGTHYTENPDVVKFVRDDGDDLPRDPRIAVGVPALTFSGPPPGYDDPSAPLFRIPDSIILVNSGVEFGPNLLLLQPPIPSLLASRSGSQLVLSWPLWATNFVPEASGALGAGASWTALTNAVGVSGSSLVATTAVNTASAFYRLRSP